VDIARSYAVSHSTKWARPGLRVPSGPFTTTGLRTRSIAQRRASGHGYGKLTTFAGLPNLRLTRAIIH
jgi:hypothetical protein